MTNHRLRQQLSEALRPLSEYHADMVNDTSTALWVYPTSFLHRYRVYEAIRADGRPLFYVAFSPGRPAFMLTNHPEKYAELAKADALHIDDPAQAVAYVCAYLELTRRFSHLLYPVSSIADVKFRKQLDEVQVIVKQEFEQRYASIITPPRAIQASQGMLVTLYVVEEQTLELRSCIVSDEGDVEQTIVVLERNLPLIYGL